MPGYSPLPRIELDPRTEAELVAAAARRVYEASGATLNDFSAGSPIMALLEGQSFAHSEFLQFANQFPEAVLVEWIGPFLGAQRRTGSGAIVEITFSIDPRDQDFIIFPGYQIATDADKTGGESLRFVTTEKLSIPPGEIEGRMKAISVTRGTENNVAANTITRSLTSLQGVRNLTNPEPATGGSDAESLEEVKERFFSLIRRRNPVSAEDWTDWFTDALGPGTTVVVGPRRSEGEFFTYENNYLKTNPSVSFFVLNPDGTPITSAQKDALETLMKWSLPVEFLGYIYPMEVNDVDMTLDVTFDSSRPYTQDLFEMTRVIRNNLFNIMTPNAVFPSDYDPTATDVESALTSTFQQAFGISNSYVDPNIDRLTSYHTPQLLGDESFQALSLKDLVLGSRIQQDDLLVEQGHQISTYFKANLPFEPVSNDKLYHTNLGDLRLTAIRSLERESYQVGEVVTDEGGSLYVVLKSFDYSGRLNIAQLIDQETLSGAKEPKDFEGFLASHDDSGKYDPDLVGFYQEDSRLPIAFPSTPTHRPKEFRPGSLIFIVEKGFVPSANASTIGGALNAGYVSENKIEVRLLEAGNTYGVGDYVKTPNPAEMQAGAIDQESCYITPLEGAVEQYSIVEEAFLMPKEDELSFSTRIQTLFDDKMLKKVDVIVFTDCNGKSTFADRPFRYAARFSAGEYVRFRQTGMHYEKNAPDRYFVALKDFTPVSADVDKLVLEDYLSEVAPSVFETDYSVMIPLTTNLYSVNIVDAMVEAGVIQTKDDLNEGDTVTIHSMDGTIRSIQYLVNGVFIQLSETLPTYRDLFRFAPGDAVSFRNESSERRYLATEHVTPIANLLVYIRAGVFEETTLSESVRWIDPEYHLEDVVHDFSNNNRAFFRVVSPVTPPEERVVWNLESKANTARVEELYGNFLKIVQKADCNSRILRRLLGYASALKLGTFQVNLSSKNLGSAANTYVLEPTYHYSVAPSFSAAPRLATGLKVVNYGEGTLAL